MSINWGKLYNEGRCREVGISWTEEEAVALFVKKIVTVEELRAGYYPEKIAEMQAAIDEAGIDTEEDEAVEEEIVLENQDWDVVSWDEEVAWEAPTKEIVEEITETEEVVEVKEEDTQKSEVSIEDLKTQATDLGIKFHPNTGIVKLQAKINEHLANNEA